MTQEYLTRKVVTAWPEARRGDLPEGAPAGSEGELIDGFSVKYEDGYLSWCPKEKFLENAIALGNVIHLPAFQIRLLAERAELNDRTVGLGRFLASKEGVADLNLGMSVTQFDLLKKQHVSMTGLLEILDARIEEMSNPAGIAELFKSDPNLETPQGYTEQIATLKKPLFGDDWLKERLVDASVEPGDYFNQWTKESGETGLSIKVPSSTGRYNLFGLATAQGQMPAEADITDAIGFVALERIVDAEGNEIALTDLKYINIAQRAFEIGASVGDSKLIIHVDRETCVASVTSVQFPADAKIHLGVTLFNANRRPA